MYSYFRHYTGPTKSYMNDERLRELPSGVPPPKGVLNSTPTPEDQAYFTNRKNLIKGWMRKRMFDPKKTWGKAATDDDKVEMVTTVTLNSHANVYVHMSHARHAHLSQVLEASKVLNLGLEDFDAYMAYFCVSYKKKEGDKKKGNKKRKVPVCVRV